MIRRAFAIGALGTALLASTVASAREPTADEVGRARTFFDAGAAAYSSARYSDAVRSFEQAYALAPRPQVLFSLAQSERKQFFASGDARYLRQAVRHYTEYLDQVPSGGRRSEAIEAKADLEARLARLDPSAGQGAAQERAEARRARVTVHSATPGARVSVDGRDAEELPYFADLQPGKHRFRVFAEGYFDAEQEVSGDKPIDVPVNLTLREKPALVTVDYGGASEVYVDGRIAATTPLFRPIEVPAGPHVLSIAANGKKPVSQEVALERGKPFVFRPSVETSNQRVVAWGMLVGGGLGLVGGGLFGLAAVGRENRAREIERLATERNLSPDELEEHNRAIEQRDTFRTTALVSASIGGALAIGGLLLFAFDKPAIAVLPPRSVEPGPAPTKPGELDISAAPLLGPGLFGGGATVRF